MTTINNTYNTQSWLNFMWSLHNDVRQSRGLKLTGLGALNEINNYLLLFFMERNFDKYELSDECRFSYLYNNFCSDEKIKEDTKLPNTSYEEKIKHNYYKVWDHWCNVQGNMSCVLRQMATSDLLKKYLKNEVVSICAFSDKDETGKTIQLIINKIYKQFNDQNNSLNDTLNFSAFGDAYEKFKQQASSDSGKTTGQHFTPDVVKDYVVKEIKPKNNETFYEPACGTGGFIHHAVKYVRSNESNCDHFINNLIANECNPEIYKPLAINMLIHDIPFDNINKQDSLDTRWNYHFKNKIDCICANPPFGSADPVEPDDYWGPLKTGKNVIKDAMAQFIMHMYQSLKNGGRCGTVSDRGIINNGSDSKNSWQTKLRKFMLENCNLYKIVLLPKETFDYTTFATCILFWVKGEPTEQVEFREITMKEVITEGQKNKVIDEDKLLGTISIDQIKAKNYSLKADDYFKVNEVKKDMSGWIKLGDVCKMMPKSKRKAADANEAGQYNFYTSSIVAKKSNFNDYSEETIIIGSGGNGSVFIDSNFSCSADNFLIRTKNTDTFQNKYTYYYLKINFTELYKLYKGNGLKHLSQVDLLNFLIPNLPLAHQTEIVEFLDQQFTTYNINKLNKQIPLFDLLIKKEWQMATEQEMENIKRDIKGIFSLSVYGLGSQCQMMKLGDICEVKCGKSIPKVNLQNDGYPYFGANGIIGYTDSYLFNGNYILVARNGTIGAVHIFDGKFYPSDHTFTLKPTNNNITYIYQYLKNYVNWKNLSVHNGMPGITRPILENIQIPIPPLHIQEQLINKINSLNEQSFYYELYAKTLQTEIDHIMETIKNMVNTKTNDDTSNDDISNDDISIADSIETIIHEHCGIDSNLLTLNLNIVDDIQKKINKASKKISKINNDSVEGVVEI
jgi:type I restriction-modification system DNA methylase subunit